MPWTVDDVDSHKKGLTDKQKAQWVRIANSVLAACIKKGGTDKTCAPSAIRQANGVVNANVATGKYVVCKSRQTLEYEPKLTIHQEKAHLVVPVVMMVEGVHNGSQGALLHEIAELGKFPDSWNGIPVVIYHPTIDDQPVSANSPEIIDTRMVGRVYNTNVEGKKLKAEVWFDEDKLNTISTDALEAVNNSKEMEVSLGMFTENSEEEGEYEGVTYIGIARNHRPDHLAILPDQIGACSIEKGCGLGANQKSEDVKQDKMIKVLNKSGFSINQIVNNVEQEYQKRLSMAYDALRSLDEHVYNYLEELYSDYLIYSKSTKEGTKMYKQTYKVESGKIEFVGEPVEVHKEVEYVVNISNNLKKEDKMSKENPCPKCVEKINALIANKESGYTEDDREWLNTFTEPQLDKISKPMVVEKKVEIEKKVEVNKLTPQQEADLAFVANQRAEGKRKMIEQIQANTSKELWPDEVLKVMSEDNLKRLSDSVKKEEVSDYSLQSGGANLHVSSEVEPLLPVGVVLETTQK